MKKLILLFLVLMTLPLAFAATVQVTADKTTVSAGGQVILNYHQAESTSYGIIQNIPSGWTAPGMAADRKVRLFIDSGDDATLTLTAPSVSVTSSFTGTYFVVPSTTYSNLNSLNIQVGAGGTTTIPDDSDDTEGLNNSMMFILAAIIIIAVIYFMKKK